MKLWVYILNRIIINLNPNWCGWSERVYQDYRNESFYLFKAWKGSFLISAVGLERFNKKILKKNKK